MIRLVMATATAALLGCGSVLAQVGAMGITPGPPLGMTSPLGIGPGAPVAPTGIPLGATEMGSLGVSPTTSGASPLGPSTGAIALCSGAGGSLPQASFGAGNLSTGSTSGIGNLMTGTSFGTGMSAAGVSASTSVFDGGGTAGTASGTCAAIGGSSLAGPAASASSPTGMGSMASVGRVGIPLGSTELGAGGLSPPPDTHVPNRSVRPSSQARLRQTGTCGITGTTSMTGMSMTSGVC